MKIYILINMHFNDRYKKLFGVDYFLKQGYNVVVLDMQNYLNPHLKHLKKSTYESDDNLDVILCNDFKKIKTTIPSLSEGVAFLYVGSSYKSVKIKNLLQRYNIKIGIIHGGIIPVFERKRALPNLFNRLKSLGIKNIIKKLVNRFYTKVFDIKYYDFLITSNYDTSLEIYNFAKPTKVIETHCIDYDLFLENKYITNEYDSKYVVFIDQYIIDHPDALESNKNPNISHDKYYNRLNILFDKIEKKINCKVIIAGHPRADITEYKRLFNGRRIEYNKTIPLIKYCEFTITHYSTAINFAILYKKPILFLSYNEFKLSELDEYIQNLSNLLNQKYINLSNPYKLENISIDEEKYKMYKMKFIKRNNIEKNTYEIFENDFLKNINI